MQEIVFKANLTTEYITVKCSTAKLILMESNTPLSTAEEKI